MGTSESADLSVTGVMTRSPEEIWRVLAQLHAHGLAVRCNLAGGELVLESKLLHVDPARGYILLEPGTNEAATAALLARPRASFYASTPSWQVEFSAGDPQKALHGGAPALRLAFPEILVTRQSRATERVTIQPHAPLHFVADAGGPISFDGVLIDISTAGFAFLQYSPNITLEPGTILKGCSIALPGHPAATVDLEVRYSRMDSLPGGRRAIRSGCRFVDTPPELKALLASFFKH
jgi:c-di-GMP-binding flagellar brake protein YcgR